MKQNEDLGSAVERCGQARSDNAEVLRKLVGDTVWYVRACIARNYHTPAEDFMTEEELREYRGGIE